MSYLIDSDWLIDAAVGRPKAVALLSEFTSAGPAISAISVAEVCEGAYGSRDPELMLTRFERFLSEFAILPVTAPVAERFAWLRSKLRRQGLLIPDMDLLIAATALVHDLTLVTRNHRHFTRIPGLRMQ